MLKLHLFELAVASLALAVSISFASEKPIRIGLIGLDTSHAPNFTRIINDLNDKDHVPGAKVVCAYPGGSPDVEASYTRVDKFTAQIRDEFHVEIVNDIPTLLKKVDAVILTSVDGRVHLKQVKPVLAAQKPVFIDKPMAASLADVKEIFRLADKAGVPCWSSSSLRFFPELVEALHDKSLGKVIGCDAYSPAHLEPHHPDLFWYAVHGVETLFTVMGPNIQACTRTSTEGTDIVTGVWDDNRLGTFRGIREGKGGYGATIFFENGIRHVEPGKGSLYKPLIEKIITFFKTGKPPVSHKETIAIFEFMDAAQKSKEMGGSLVKIR